MPGGSLVDDPPEVHGHHIAKRRSPSHVSYLLDDMQTTGAPVHPTSPPFVIDTDMGTDSQDPDLDFSFFDNSLEAPASPGIFLGDDLATASPEYTTFGSPLVTGNKHSAIKASPYLNTSQGGRHTTLSALSSASPGGSFQDSSSDSSRNKRKSSTDSSQSALTGRDMMMVDDGDMSDWKADDLMTGGDGPGYGLIEGAAMTPFDGTVDPTAIHDTFNFNDKSMENVFDFESAASSPTPYGTAPASITSPEAPSIKYERDSKKSPKLKARFKRHAKADSVS